MKHFSKDHAVMRAVTRSTPNCLRSIKQVDSAKKQSKLVNIIGETASAVMLTIVASAGLIGFISGGVR